MKEPSCYSINNGICFNRFGPKSITYCTLTNNSNGLGWPNVVENYEGKPIDWDAFFESRETEKEIYLLVLLARNVKAAIKSQ